MDSEQPSLYDVFNDTYGEPVRTKKQERAVVLPAELLREAEQRMAESRTVGREFSTVRQPKAAKEKPVVTDIDGRALLHIKGRVPLHLRLELYDLFDGHEWLPMPDEKNPPLLSLHDRRETVDRVSSADRHGGLRRRRISCVEDSSDRHKPTAATDRSLASSHRPHRPARLLRDYAADDCADDSRTTAATIGAALRVASTG